MRRGILSGAAFLFLVLGMAACGASAPTHPAASNHQKTVASRSTTTTVQPSTTTSEPPPITTVIVPPPTTATVPPTTATSTAPSNGLTGFGATVSSWDASHTSDPSYEGFPAYGPTVSTPEGPTPQFIEVQSAGGIITQFIQVLPDGTSLSSAMSIAMQSLPPDSSPSSFVQSNQNGSCGFWNLSSQMLAAAGESSGITIEMAYDDSNGAPHYEPNDINTLTFESGTNDSSGTC
jgi:hypothetical protein